MSNPTSAIPLLLAIALASASASEQVVVYTSTEDFAMVRENLEFAITEQGLVVNNVMQIGEMLDRTRQDLGYEKIYINAESLEFCSASLSYQMMALDPRDITACPYTISAYVTTAEPDKVYVAYRKPVLSAGSGQIAVQLADLLDTIAAAAVAD